MLDQVLGAAVADVGEGAAPGTAEGGVVVGEGEARAAREGAEVVGVGVEVEGAEETRG